MYALFHTSDATLVMGDTNVYWKLIMNLMNISYKFQGEENDPELLLTLVVLSGQLKYVSQCLMGIL